MTQEAIDSRAIEISTEAITKINMHMDECVVRHKEITQGQKNIYKLIGDVKKSTNGLVFKIGGTLIIGLFGMVGFLLTKVMEWTQ